DFFLCFHVNRSYRVSFDSVRFTFCMKISDLFLRSIEGQVKILDTKMSDSPPLRHFKCLIQGEFHISIACHSQFITYFPRRLHSLFFRLFPGTKKRSRSQSCQSKTTFFEKFTSITIHIFYYFNLMLETTDDRQNHPFPSHSLVLSLLFSKSIHSRPVHNRRGSLLTAEHIHILNIDVRRTTDHKRNDLRHIAAFQRLPVFICLLSPLPVSVKPYFRKFRLHHMRRRHLSHADPVFMKIDP